MKKLLLCTTTAFLLGIANISTFAQSGESLIVNENQYMRVAHHEDFNIAADQDFTMSLWVKMDGVVKDSNMRFIAKRNTGKFTGDNRTGYEFWGGNSTAASGWVALNTPKTDSGNILSGFSTRGGVVGEWFHLALVVDRVNNKIIFYHDGVDVKSTTSADWSCLNTHDLFVGCGVTDADPSFPFRGGAIDNLRFYRKALTTEELAVEKTINDVVDLAPEVKNSLRAAYDFENVTNVVPDVSGNDRNGSFVYIVAPSEGPAHIISDVVKQETWLTGRGNAHEVIIQGHFVVSGTESTLLQSTTISLDGTTALSDIKAIKVYSTGTAGFDERNPGSAQLLGSTTNLTTGDITILLNGSLELGKHNLWVTAQISEQATEGNKIDIQWKKINLGSGEYTIVNSNPSGDCQIVLKKTLVYAPGDHNSISYRIPAIIRAADGSLVITTDKRKANQKDLPEDIDVLVNRSTDGGLTWSEPLTIAEGKGRNKGFGDASLTKCLNGELIIVYYGGRGFFNSTPTLPAPTYVSKSYDNGITWSTPIDITSQLFGDKCPDPVRSNWTGSFCASGVGLCTSQGRIMVAAAVRYDKTKTIYNHVFYSDDNGVTWKVSGLAKVGGDEAKLVELNDGSIMMSIRRWKGGARYYNISKDHGETWGDGTGTEGLSFSDLVEPGCNGDMVRFSSTKTGADRDRILHTVPNDATTRKNVSILVSYDEAKTWSVKKTIYPSESIYSSIAVLPDETIGVYFEECLGNRLISMYYVNFSLNWLTDGADPHKGVETFNIGIEHNAEQGKVRGQGVFAINSEAILTATPTSGFEFEKWTTQDGADVSTENPYKFTLEKDEELKAVFSVASSIKTTNKSNVSVYPNPFVESIDIEGLTIGDEIVVYNLLGSAVVKSIASNSHTRLKLPSSLAAGQYIVQIVQSGSVQNFQVVKGSK